MKKTWSQAWWEARKIQENTPGADPNAGQFIWNDKRYHTRQAPKEVSDNYWDSKNFLRDYYSTEPFFKRDTTGSNQYDLWDDYVKNKYGTTWLDYFDKIKNTPEYNNWDSKRNKEMRDTLDALFKPATYSEFPQEAKDYQDKLIRDKYLQGLDDPSYYFSITSEPNPDNPIAGYQDAANKKFYVSNYKSDSDKFHTTSVHELSHKADTKDRRSYYTSTRIPDVDVDQINKFGTNLSQDRFNYITDPSETEARKMSTLYFMNRSLGKNIKSEIGRAHV
mgnify:CR=1 FL=1